MAFNCVGTSGQGYYHDVSAFSGGSNSRQLISAWLRPAADSAYRRIFHTNITTASAADSLQLTILSNNKICIGQDASNTAALSECTDAAVTANKWIHVLAWGGDGQTPQLWLNGVRQSGTNTVALGAGNTNARFYIGMRTSGDSTYKGDVAEVCHWITNTAADLPAPTDQEAMMLYRSNNPWSYKPGALSLARPFQALDQPAIFRGSGTGASVKVGSPTLASEHAPITGDNFSFISIVGGGGGGATEEAAASFGFSLSGTALAGSTATSNISVAISTGSTAPASADSQASITASASLGFASTNTVSIESFAAFSVSSNASIVASAVASANAIVSVGLQAAPSVVVVAESSITLAPSLGVVATGQAVTAGSIEADIVSVVSLSANAAAQALAESQVAIDVELASSVIAQAAAAAGITIAQVLGMSCDGSTLSGDIVTPDGRKCTVSANLRACSIPGSARNITIN